MFTSVNCGKIVENSTFHEERSCHTLEASSSPQSTMGRQFDASSGTCASSISRSTYTAKAAAGGGVGGGGGEQWCAGESSGARGRNGGRTQQQRRGTRRQADTKLGGDSTKHSPRHTMEHSLLSCAFTKRCLQNAKISSTVGTAKARLTSSQP